jgi:hypothetical protein
VKYLSKCKFYKKNTATLQILQKIRWSPLFYNQETFIYIYEKPLASFFIS